MSENTNLELWNQWYKTPKEFLKDIPGGANLTSIDAYYRIRKATEVLGPMGKNWGMSLRSCQIINFPVLRENGEVVNVPTAFVNYEFWWKDPTYQGPGVLERNIFDVQNSIELKSKGKGAPRFHSDWAKVVYTDTLTKALSYIGLSADIFMGSHADSKYFDSPSETAAPEPVTPPRKETPAPKAQEAPQDAPETTNTDNVESYTVKQCIDEVNAIVKVFSPDEKDPAQEYFKAKGAKSPRDVVATHARNLVRKTRNVAMLLDELKEKQNFNPKSMITDAKGFLNLDRTALAGMLEPPQEDDLPF